MTDIKQPELPEPYIEIEVAEGSYEALYSDDQMHAHYAKGRQDEREEHALQHIPDFGRLQSDLEKIAEELVKLRTKQEAACWFDLEDHLSRMDSSLSALKQSLAQPTQENIADVWHEGTKSFYTAKLIKKLTPEEALNPEGAAYEVVNSKGWTAKFDAHGFVAEAPAQQPAQAAVPEWQPIETAPKDTSEFIAYYPPHTGKNGTVWGMDITAARYANGKIESFSGYSQGHPSHWMAMPDNAAPEREGGVV